MMLTSQILILASNSSGTIPGTTPLSSLPLAPAAVSQAVEADSKFDMSTDQALTVEKIIRATFANPDRRKFPESMFAKNKVPLCPEGLNAEQLIQRISSEIPFAMMGFNFEKIYVHDTSRLFGSIDKTKWVEDLKTLKWYGPFSNGTDIFKFQTADTSGKFYGLHFEVFLNKQRDIYLNFIGHDTNACGVKFSFGKTADTAKIA
jgi:hypothetical protein